MSNNREPIDNAGLDGLDDLSGDVSSISETVNPEDSVEVQAEKISAEIHNKFDVAKETFSDVLEPRNQTGKYPGNDAYSAPIARIDAENKQAVREEVRDLENRLAQRLEEMDVTQDVIPTEEMATEVAAAPKEIVSGNLAPGQTEDDMDSIEVDEADVPVMLQIALGERNDLATKLTAMKAAVARLRHERKIISDALDAKGIKLKDVIEDYLKSMKDLAEEVVKQ